LSPQVTVVLRLTLAMSGIIVSGSSDRVMPPQLFAGFILTHWQALTSGSLAPPAMQFKMRNTALVDSKWSGKIIMIVHTIEIRYRSLKGEH
jgi:hypothetical protein